MGRSFRTGRVRLHDGRGRGYLLPLAPLVHRTLSRCYVPCSITYPVRVAGELCPELRLDARIEPDQPGIRPSTHRDGAEAGCLLLHAALT
jgi:hypothetical protein